MNNARNQSENLQPVAKTGEILAHQGITDAIRLVIAGGVAGLLNGLTRTTADCDVLWNGVPEHWDRIAAAAAQVAIELDLPPTWLNKDCSIYADSFPLGWEDRAEFVDRFGPLEVHCVSRLDLIASKVVSSPKRPYDLGDLRGLKPTREELDKVEEHLDRLASEHLDGDNYEPQRAILQLLRDES